MIAILDYGSGNLRSAERAFATTGKDVTVTSDPAIALEAEGLVIPGVGAFASCMNGLNSIGGASIVQERLRKERPILGICIGMQVMFTKGTENSISTPHAGIGIWDATVTKINSPILPHMGWNTVIADSSSILFKGLENESFYFVHSYAAKEPVGKLQAWTTYTDTFVSAVEDGYISATQFHPEKSGAAGLVLISNWANSL